MNEELIAKIRPGMDLCSSDYRKWGDVDRVIQPAAGAAHDAVVAGRDQESGAAVYVPASAVLSIEGDKCVRVTAPLADVRAQGWHQRPAYLGE